MLRAKSKYRRIEIFAMDLLFMLYKAHYDADGIEPPSVRYYGTADTRSAKEIINGVLEKMGGG